VLAFDIPRLHSHPIIFVSKLSSLDLVEHQKVLLNSIKPIGISQSRLTFPFSIARWKIRCETCASVYDAMCDVFKV